MNPAAAPRWAKLNADQRKAAVSKLLDQNVAPSTIAWRLNAPPKEVSRFAALIRREAWAKEEQDEAVRAQLSQVTAKAAEPDTPAAAPADGSGGAVVDQADAATPPRNPWFGVPEPVEENGAIDGAGAEIAEHVDPEAALPQDQAEDHAAEDFPAAQPAEAAVDQPQFADAVPSTESEPEDAAAELGDPTAAATWPIDYKAMAREERDRLIVAWWNEGLSQGDIVHRFTGTTRHAIAGVLNRLRKSGRISVQPRPPSGPKTPTTTIKREAAFRGPRLPGHRVVPAAKPVVAEAAEPKTAATRNPVGRPPKIERYTKVEDYVRVEKDQAFEPIRGRQPISLPQLTAHTCRWPVGDVTGADQMFCGAMPFEAGPYCGSHARLAYTTPRAIKELRRVEAKSRVA